MGHDFAGDKRHSSRSSFIISIRVRGARPMAKKNISPEQKLMIVLEIIKEERHIGDIASDYGVHQSAIHRWKKELLSGADKVYATSKNAKAAAKEKQEQEQTIDNLYTQIGRLTTQLDWLKKKSGGILPRE